MKAIMIIVGLVATNLVCRAQTSILYPIPQLQSVRQPIFYVDAVKMNSAANILHWINPNQIKSIDAKGNAFDNNGEVHITLKNHKVLDSLLNDEQLSLQDILYRYVIANEQRKPVLFIWDDKLITDTTGIRFPLKRITSVTVLKADEMPYFKTAFPDMLMVMISTQAPVIYIRGAERRK